MGEEQLTPGARAAIQVHEALIRQLVSGQERLIFEVGKVGNLLARGDERFQHLEKSHADNKELGEQVTQAVSAISETVAVMKSQLETLKLIVYGAVAFTLLGTLSTLGLVILWALGVMGGK